MKFVFSLSVMATIVCLSAPGYGAEQSIGARTIPKSYGPDFNPWSFAFGAAAASDYVFRGITLSAHRPSAAAYVETSYSLDPNLQIYVNVSGESIKFANRATSEADYSAGIRRGFGSMALDLGVREYAFYGGASSYILSATGAQAGAISNPSYYEAFWRGTWTTNDIIMLGANVFYAPDWGATGASEFYYSGTIKLSSPKSILPRGVGAYLSGEIGRQEMGAVKQIPGVYSASQAGTALPSYVTWNVGVGLTWKAFSFEIRYSDTTLSRSDCFILTGDPSARTGGKQSVLNTAPALQSNWCGSAYVAKLSIDLTSADLN